MSFPVQALAASLLGRACLLLGLEVDQPAPRDQLVELAAGVDVGAREQQDLGVADLLVELRGALRSPQPVFGRRGTRGL